MRHGTRMNESSYVYQKIFPEEKSRYFASVHQARGEGEENKMQITLHHM